MARDRAAAFAPGRVNLIGEHTDYNGGLALPFSIAQGVTVRGQRSDEPCISAHAEDLDEHDRFALEDRSPARGWRAFVRGVVAELGAAGLAPGGARLQIGGDLPRGAGLSSSAALEVALCLTLTALRGRDGAELDGLQVAQLCSRVESEWVGARTGLLDQLASLFGEPDAALLIDFATLAIEPVPLRLGGWQLVVVDSGERHAHASSGYNERRSECEQASRLLGVRFLAEAQPEEVGRLAEPLRSRARHVLGESRRVEEAVAALRADDLQALAALLNASHASLRDCYEVSTPAMERTVRGLLEAGAAGARMIGGGFGGSALAAFAPGIEPPAGALHVRPGHGAHVLEV
jgi:galactokinase